MISRRILIPLLTAGLALGSATRLPAEEAAPTTAAPRRRLLTESNLLVLLTATLQHEYVKTRGELELNCPAPTWKPRVVPDEPLTLKILEMPRTGLTSSFFVRFELSAAHQTLGEFQLPVQARVWREMWMARSPLKRGDPVAQSDVALERHDVLALHEPLADFSPDDPALDFCEPVQAGTPVLARQVKARPVIHRGQLADVLVQDGALSIKLKVEVLEDGAPGQMIRARNVVSRQDLFGKVLNPQTILVTL